MYFETGKVFSVLRNVFC